MARSDESDGSDRPMTDASAALPLDELEARITELAGHLNASQHRWLTLIAEFDRREGWGGDGVTRSCAHWLSWKCGLDAGAAREKVRVARALESLPHIDASMARGELSYSKVRALTRVATADNEDTLLMIALHGTAHHVETLVRRYRRAQEAAELSREAQQFENRGLHYHYDDDGSLVLQARLPADAGAVLLRALDIAIDWPCRNVSAEAPAATTPPTPADVSAETSGEHTWSQRRADALARCAESFLAHGAAALAGGDRHQVVVHVDAEALARRSAGRSELDDGPSLAVETVRRFCCDTSVVTITEDAGGQPLDVGRKTRSIPPAIARALRSRDAGCRFPGCTHRKFVDGHHIRHWADGGETKLSNLVLLCRVHHRAVHEGQVDVRVLDDGALRFTDPRGRVLVAAPPSSGDADDIPSHHRRCGPEIDRNTAATRWCGERLDAGLVVEAMLARRAFLQREDHRPVPPSRSGAPPRS